MHEDYVRVWSYLRHHFIHHIPCPGEKRVRIDIHDGLENYGVYEVKPNPDGSFEVIKGHKEARDWQIDYS